MPSPATLLRAVRELGLAQVAAYARYQASKRSGWLWRQSQADLEYARRAAPPAPALGCLPLPEAEVVQAMLRPESLAQIEATAVEICNGQVRLFDGPLLPLDFTPPVPPGPWPQHESQTWIPFPLPAGSSSEESPLARHGGLDIKFVWEPARFGWAVHLARAAHLRGDPDGQYRAAFWAHTARFLAANPPGLGPQWASAQEVGLRLISLCLAWEVFGAHSSPEQAALLSVALSAHAARIPASLDYARAQNNNHRLSEAAALYTAGLYLPSHPAADSWRRSGWAEFHAGVCSQFTPSGEYCQHSANYQRLALQLALWVQTLAGQAGEAFPRESQERLAGATRWLTSLLDATSGRLPNLGPNDGASILPLANAPYQDYRPVLQCAWRAFCGAPLLAQGEWDEMSAWLSGAPIPEMSPGSAAPAQERAVKRTSPLCLHTPHAWAYLRSTHFRGRPGHADQLHLDLWWHGLNLAQDAGTYLYNAPPPWDNRLACAEVHNTLTVDGQDQMQRAGRFLYLDPAQAEITEDLRDRESHLQRIAARQHGYRRLGLLHVRSVTVVSGADGDEWLVEDQVFADPERGVHERTHTVRLHWLLPDLPWTLQTDELQWVLGLKTPHGPVQVQLQASLPGTLLLARAGERLAGVGEVVPTWGWVSTTYGQRAPALALALSVQGRVPVTLQTRWILPAW